MLVEYLTEISPVLAIKADELADDVRDAATLTAALDLPRMTASGRALLAVDQLDALGELADLRTSRFNAPLWLIEQVSRFGRRPNV